MRERQRALVVLRTYSRITPAYAGKTSARSFALALRWDHPRVCGKDSLNPSCRHAISGSPPRMRERLEGGVKAYGVERITPAYAGKTVNLHVVHYIVRDHPRVCGKDSHGFLLFCVVWGSPPRMRERLLTRLPHYLMLRITPAYAGKTSLFIAPMAHAEDHPRVCGKDRVVCLVAILCMGSPPRMRERR